MVKWIRPVFGVLAWTGLAIGQTATLAAQVPAGAAGEQFVTVQEVGRPPQKCRVLKTWIEPDGTPALQVMPVTAPVLSAPAVESQPGIILQQPPPAAVAPQYPGAPPAPTVMVMIVNGSSSPTMTAVPTYPGMPAQVLSAPLTPPQWPAPPSAPLALPRPEGSTGPADAAAKNKAFLATLLAGKQQPAETENTGGTAAPDMKSAPAAGTPKSATDAAVGFDPNEPNAFSAPRVAKKSPSANAFTEPPCPPSPPDPRAADPAGNAFQNPERPQLPDASTPRAPEPGVPPRSLPAPAPYPAPQSVSVAPTKPDAPVVAAAYRPPERVYDLTPMVAVLRGSLYPSQREEAAEKLGALNWRRQPEVVDVLVTQAKDDPAPTVRAECVRSLGRLKANTLPAVVAVRALQCDEDPRVRHEAHEAFAILAGITPKAAEPADAPLSH